MLSLSILQNAADYRGFFFSNHRISRLPYKSPSILQPIETG